MAALTWPASLAIVGALATVFIAVQDPHASEDARSTSGVSARADAACQPSVTLPGTDLKGRVRPASPRMLGTGPVHVGPFWGSRARLLVDPAFQSKFYYQLDRAGPSVARVLVRRLDAPGRGLFEVQRTGKKGRTVRSFVRVLKLDTRRMNRPRRGERLLGQPGSIRLPALGCYQLQVRWSGGGWNRTFAARPDPIFDR